MAAGGTGRPTVVSVRDVTKRFVVRKDDSLKERLVTLGRRGRRFREDFVALDAVDFDIEAGTTVGLIGHNGSGKSTLLKVIGGIIEPSTGEVLSRGRVAALLELGAGFHPDLTGRENVYLNGSILGISTAELDRRFDEILAFADIGDFIDTQVKFYSSGMYIRLAFAVAVHTDPDILLVDEVLSVGDEAFQQKCMDKIRSFQREGRTIIFVTHNLGQVIDLCDRAILLNKGHVVFDGTPRDTVAMFRDYLEGRRTSATELPSQLTATGSIDQVRARYVKGIEGSSVEVDATFRFSESIPGWRFMVQIDTPGGVAIYASSSEGYTLGTLEGSVSAHAVIEDARLAPGTYLVSVFALDGTGRHMMDFVHRAQFAVPGKAAAGGGVLPVTMRFRRD